MNRPDRLCLPWQPGPEVGEGAGHRGRILDRPPVPGTKHAAWAITEGLRLESPPWLRVTTISPGVVESELANTISDVQARDYMIDYRRNAIGPEAIAAAVAYAVDTPPDVDVNEIVIRPTSQR